MEATMDQANQKLEALVFDAYGTLFDVDSVTGACEEAFPGRGQELSRLWRTTQLRYTWLCSLMGRYEDFWQLTGRALGFAYAVLGLEPAGAVRARLVEGYLRLEPYAEVPQALRSLAGRPLAILSNGSPGMLAALLEHAGLGGTFTAVLSADAVRTYKPSPRVYELAPRHLGVDTGRIGFVSSNSFDVIGAAAYGFRTIWVNRTAAPLDQLGQPPHLTVADLAELVDAVRQDPR
jgi:2-haloacid dehalogenase